ncbi:hypothetical protein [Streptomyces canus]|uniref:hypothetical protein n=1 Tax=Streptomyces canus TaxID=58343 RepID=UPI003865C437|nr:hypothetical protein OH824_14210 [Streptomyces canus]
MTKLNLDETKQYDADYTADNGHTWQAGSTGNCAAMVEADVASADQNGHTVTVDGQTVVIDHGHSQMRWTPQT